MVALALLSATIPAFAKFVVKDLRFRALPSLTALTCASFFVQLLPFRAHSLWTRTFASVFVQLLLFRTGQIFWANTSAIKFIKEFRVTLPRFWRTRAFASPSFKKTWPFTFSESIFRAFAATIFWIPLFQEPAFSFEIANTFALAGTITEVVRINTV